MSSLLIIYFLKMTFIYLCAYMWDGCGRRIHVLCCICEVRGQFLGVSSSFKLEEQP